MKTPWPTKKQKKIWLRSCGGWRLPAQTSVFALRRMRDPVESASALRSPLLHTGQWLVSLPGSSTRSSLRSPSPPCLSDAVARLACASRAIAPASDIERLLYPCPFDIRMPTKFILHRAVSIVTNKYYKEHAVFRQLMRLGCVENK